MYIIPSVYNARDSHKFRVLAAIMMLFIGKVDLGTNSYYTDGTQTDIFRISYCFYCIKIKTCFTPQNVWAVACKIMTPLNC